MGCTTSRSSDDVEDILAYAKLYRPPRPYPPPEEDIRSSYSSGVSSEGSGSFNRMMTSQARELRKLRNSR
jgi:hypothetical protein